MSNQKYEITGIAHEKYPFLHRIRALRDIGPTVKAGDLSGDLRVRAQFITGIIANQYNALKIVVLNRTKGEVDRLALRIEDVIGVKQVPDNPDFPKGVSPHIWDDYGKAAWYVFRPTAADYQALRQAVGVYLDVFRERVQERERPAPVRKSSGRSASRKGREER